MSDPDLDFRLELTETPPEEAAGIILAGLSAFNEGDVGPADRRLLSVLIRDERDEIVGGLSGYTSWGWLFTQLIFIPAPLRGRGLAGTLLGRAEQEAVLRGCHGAWIDTFNPQALAAYRRQGYDVFGELPDFVAGRSRYFLRKPLASQA